jgi:hypothetical protein
MSNSFEYETLKHEILEDRTNHYGQAGGLMMLLSNCKLVA